MSGHLLLGAAFRGDSPPVDRPPIAVQVWRASLADAAAQARRCAPLLSNDERARAARFRSPADADRFVAARGVLRRCLSHLLGLPPAEVPLSTGTHGKPCLPANPRGADLRFNLSHGGDVVLVAVTLGHEVGVDVEPLQAVPEWRMIAASHFAPREAAALDAAADAAAASFLALWVRKEACAKAVGLGLGLPLNVFEVPLASDGLRPIRWRAPAGPYPAPPLVVGAIQVPAGYVGAVAVEGHAAELRFEPLLA